MAIAEQHNLNINRSSDGSEFNSNVHREMLILITEACNMLKADGLNYTDTDEPAISGELVRFARQYCENKDLSEWAWPYTIHDDPPENDKSRKGKSRKRVDIIIERAQRGRHPRVRFEAKRLKKPGFPASEYVGQKGLGEFVSGNYAPESNVVGMLGYVQSDDCRHWANKLLDEVQAKKQAVHLKKDSRWKKAGLKNIEHCYTTRHTRSTDRGKFLVYHLLLNFVMIGRQ